MGNHYCSLVLHCCTLRLKWTSLALQICEVCECLVFLLPPFSPSFLLHPIHSLLSSPRYTRLERKFSWDFLCFYSHAMFMCVKAFLINTSPSGIGSCCQQVCSCVVLSVLCCFIFSNGNCHQQNIAKSKLSGKIVKSSCHCRRQHSCHVEYCIIKTKNYFLLPLEGICWGLSYKIR